MSGVYRWVYFQSFLPAFFPTFLPSFLPIFLPTMSSLLKHTIARYETETMEQHKSHGLDFVYSDRQNKEKIGRGTIAFELCKDAYRGFFELAGPFEPTGGVGPYTGKAAAYNKFRAPVSRHHTFAAPKPVDEVMRLCGMSSKSGNNYTHTRNSYIEPYYNHENREQVKERFEALATQWVSEAKEAEPAFGLQMIAEAYGDLPTTPVAPAALPPPAPVAAAPPSVAPAPAASAEGKKPRKAPVHKKTRDYIRPNEVVYNTVCPKGGKKETWAATYVHIADTLVMDDGRCFLTTRDFSKAHRKENNLTGDRDGFNGCHVIRDGKRVMLCDLLPLTA